jgi:hypothetical protein
VKHMNQTTGKGHTIRVKHQNCYISKKYDKERAHEIADRADKLTRKVHVRPAAKHIAKPYSRCTNKTKFQVHNLGCKQVEFERIRIGSAQLILKFERAHTELS